MLTVWGGERGGYTVGELEGQLGLSVGGAGAAMQGCHLLAAGYALARCVAFMSGACGYVGCVFLSRT
jgi:hypothetical protein